MLLLLAPLTVAAQGNSIVLSTQSGIATVVTFLIAGLNLLTWILFLVLSILIDPQFMFGTVDNVNLENVLNSIWVLSRDLMNVGFALILIGAAIYTIITAKKGFAADHLKTFVLCVVMVNFSWFVPRVILDVGNIAAATVYGIPSLITSEFTDNKCTFSSKKSMADDGLTCNPDGAGGFTCQCAMVTNARFFLSSQDAQDLDDFGWYCPLGPAFCLQMQDLDVSTVSGHSAVLNGLIVNHARLQQMAIVSKAETGGSEVQNMITFLLRSAITLAIHVALFFPLAALVLAFAVRIPVLWLTISFMPFALLKFVLPSEYITEYPQKIWDYFLKAAFLPAIVGIPLSIGFILVNASGAMVTGFPQFDALKDIQFTIGGVNNFYQLLWQMMTLGVLWVGVFSVLEKMGGIFATGSGFLKGIGESIGGIALKAPLSIPIPGPSGTSVTPLSMLKSIDPRRINYALSNAEGGLPDVLKQLGGKGPGASGPETNAAAEKLSKIDEQGFNKVNDTLKQVAIHIERGEKDAADRLIRDQLGVVLGIPFANSANVEGVVTSLRDQMQRRNPTDPRLTEIGTRLKELTDARAKPGAIPAGT